MHERNSVPRGPREKLIFLLSQDFRTDEERELDQQPETGELTNTLSAFLTRVRTREDIEERLVSERCAEIADEASRTLETAGITDSFKGLIVSHLVRAYAWQSRIDDIVSPASLGILSGEGVFDPREAKGIEARALRSYLFDIINKQVLVAQQREETEEPVIIIRDPAAYAHSMNVFDSWTLDYIGTYGEDAFAGTELGAYLDAAKQVHLVSEEEAEDSGWAVIIERLQRLRGEDSSE